MSEGMLLNVRGFSDYLRQLRDFDDARVTSTNHHQAFLKKLVLRKQEH